MTDRGGAPPHPPTPLYHLTRLVVFTLYSAALCIIGRHVAYYSPKPAPAFLNILLSYLSCQRGSHTTLLLCCRMQTSSAGLWTKNKLQQNCETAHDSLLFLLILFLTAFFFLFGFVFSFVSSSKNDCPYTFYHLLEASKQGNRK